MAKRIVVLGNSLAGVKALEDIRSQDKDVEMTVVGFDGYYSYNRELFAAFLNKTKTAAQIFCKPKDFYEKNKIQVISDKVLTRINLKRQKIFTEDKVQIDFDVLIISETPEEKKPDIKGANKSGVFGFKKLKDIEQILKSDPFTDTIVIEADSLEALSLACIFLKKNKEVYFVTQKPYLLSDILNEDMSKALRDSLTQQKLKVITDNQIVEILGDSDAKAVRLKTGKVIAGSMVILEKTYSDLRIFSDIETVGPTFLVNESFEVSPNVFAVDTAIGAIDHLASAEELEYQGQVIANKILGKDISLTKSLAQRKVLISDHVINVVGDINAQGQEVQHSFASEPLSAKRVFIKDGIIQGAVLVNSEGDLEQVVRMITEKTPLVVTEATSPNG